MELTVVSLDKMWREFIADDLNASPPFVENSEDKGGKLEVKFLSKGTEWQPSDIYESPSPKKAALFTHPGAGELAEALREAGVSILNGGRLADAAHTNPDFVALQASKLRFFVAPIEEEVERKNVIIARTKRGIVPQWLEYSEIHNLFPGARTSEEGIHIRGFTERDEVLERKLESLCRGWGYIGFLFLRGAWVNGEFLVESLSPFGPEAFWPAFFAGYQGNISKFFFKMENSRKLMSKIDFVESIVCLKATLPPYPYNKTPWVTNEDERKFVENHLCMGAYGHKIKTPKEPICRVFWLDVNEEHLSFSPEVAYVTGTRVKDIVDTVKSMNENLQVKELISI